MPTFNPFPNKPWFLLVCSRSLLKTLREKEKLLIMSNFSFSHSVFYLFGELSASSTNLKLLSANSMSLEESKICCLEKGKQPKQRCLLKTIFKSEKKVLTSIFSFSCTVFYPSQNEFQIFNYFITCTSFQFGPV